MLFHPTFMSYVQSHKEQNEVCCFREYEAQDDYLNPGEVGDVGGWSRRAPFLPFKYTSGGAKKGIQRLPHK